MLFFMMNTHEEETLMEEKRKMQDRVHGVRFNGSSLTSLFYCATILATFPTLTTSFNFHRINTSSSTTMYPITSLLVQHHHHHHHRHHHHHHPFKNSHDACQPNLNRRPTIPSCYTTQRTLRFAVNRKNAVDSNFNSNSPAARPRKKKKNKYAKFSKVDNNKDSKTNESSENKDGDSTSTYLDPFEALLAESEAKNKQLEQEKALKRNKNMIDLLDEETKQKLKNEKRQRNKILFPDNKVIDPYDPTTYGYTELGTILGPHGVHGLVKVAAVTDFPDRLCKPGIRHMKAPNRRSPREIRIVEGRHRLKDEYLVKLEHIGDRNDALKLRGSVLFARQEERPDGMDKDEFLINELVNLEVRLVTGYGEDFEQEMSEEENEKDARSDDYDDVQTDESALRKKQKEDSLGGKFIGTIGGVVLGEEMCAIPGLGQDLLEIILPKGAYGTPSWRDELVLIPFVPEIVPTIDIEQEVVYINPPKGLLDLTYVKEEKTRIKGFLPERSSFNGKRN